MSARWISTSTWSPWSGWQAIPIEPPISSVSPSTTNGSRSAVWRISATAWASAAPTTSGSRMPNSSPPRRATVSAVRSVVLRRSATSWSSTSPWWWPSVSLTSLKWSRSMIITAAPPWRRSAARTACWTRSRNSTRFGRPVSASWSDWCSLAIAWRPPRWIASSGRNSSGSTSEREVGGDHEHRREPEQQAGGRGLEEEVGREVAPEADALGERDRAGDEARVQRVEDEGGRDDAGQVRWCRRPRRVVQVRQAAEGREHEAGGGDRERCTARR